MSIDVERAFGSKAFSSMEEAVNSFGINRIILNWIVSMLKYWFVYICVYLHDKTLWVWFITDDQLKRLKEEGVYASGGRYCNTDKGQTQSNSLWNPPKKPKNYWAISDIAIILRSIRPRQISYTIHSTYEPNRIHQQNTIRRDYKYG